MEENKGIIFSRPPRFLPELPKGEVEIPAPPSNQDKPEIGWLSILLPPAVMIAGSVLMSMAMKSNSFYIYITMATTAVTIFISILNATSQIKKYKKYIRTRKKKYLQLINDLKTEFTLAKEQQIVAMNEINPSPADCLDRLKSTDSKLWERTPAHEDFLSVRMGIGSIPASLQPKYQKAGLLLEPDPLQEEPEKLGKAFEMVSDLPVCLEILKSELCGIAGSEKEVRELLKVLALQIVTNHCYQDVKLVLLLKEDELAEWEWIKYLPHVWDDDFRIRFMMCGSAIAHNTLGILFEQFKERENRVSKSDQGAYSFSQYVFVVSDSELLEEEAISKYLFSGHRHLGVSTIFTAERKEYLPMNCRSVVTLQGQVGNYANKDNGIQVTFNVDAVNAEELEKASRYLAPVRLKKSSANFTLPKSITLLETMSAKRVEDVDVLNKWRANKTYNGMGVPIGARAGGELFNLDMQAYETSHGPHGLVAGTTGSGKSELLQSIIISLAINFHPHDVVFVLIDYKGGGMADVFKGMPHLVGTITNLGGNQTTRALVSIKSELKRRQAIFSAHEVNNIDKYQKLYHAGKAKEPLPHLIMIADEFAELKAEQPDFMKELVSAARVGRSLGVHLILATQKPAGVVDDQIWSNSRFKICLKVQDETDSRDVIKRPDAAMIKEPGRGYIQVGNDEIFEMFQSTFSGADYDPDGQASKKSKGKKKLFKVNLDGRSAQIYPTDQEHVDKSERDSQLKAMVEYITAVAKENQIEALKGPWLPPLAETIYLDEVLDYIKPEEDKQKEVWQNQNEELIATIGIEDDPKGQKQEALALNFTSEGNLIIYGAAGTGKTTLIEGIVMSLAYRYSPQQFSLYIMDFGGGTLKKYEQMPHCGGVMSIEDEDKINQFMLFIFRMMEERKEAMAQHFVANIQAYNKMSEQKFPYIILVIDNYFALSETYEEVDEKILTLSREGLKYGIYLIVTSNSPTLIRYKFSINFKMAISLQLTDETEYSNVVGRTEGLVPDKVLGRGLIKVEYPVEFQATLPYGKEQTILDVVKYFNKMDGIKKAVPIPQMPERISILKINQETSPDMLTIGLNQNDMLPVTIDLKTNIAIMVAGEVQTGKSTTLISWIKAIRKKVGEEQLQLYLADSNNMGLFNLAQEIEHFDLKNGEIEEITSELRDTLEQRREELNECRRNNGDVNQVYTSWKQIVIAFDNINEFAEDGDFDFKELMEFVIKKCYGLKVIILAAGIEAEYNENWDGLVKAIKEAQVGVLLGSIKEQSLYNIRVPYGYYEKEMQLGDGYLITKNKYIPLKLATI
ncbi:type VII secretion protein EssC [Cellulosilyticum lentocellum]|uniref:Cell division protein FtsK/SpoIIIE n=1 Tax=Cellulosilyticum lentocellum (strain ATCC 49066 / DSM 5427 / NCIMB 11756 / RHM5) TaxID=642492 RepID=F2JHU6_CELLD|nr:type VII secretion protein EssC [Cellulosilyticum lentocellum]ADZ85438.1 cell division protein FtsK/SpoIIIE [Cellulosilyticum lentocellum DSM 5427]